jgi:hypothetical protein
MAATIFVDHFSRLLFVHLQQSLTSDDTDNASFTNAPMHFNAECLKRSSHNP